MDSCSNGPSTGFFSGSSFKREKEMNSGRALNVLDVKDNENAYIFTFDEFKSFFQNDIAFKILINSKFLMKVTKNDNQVSINYENIIIEDGNTQITKNINEIKEISPEFRVLKDNYKEFLHFLNKIENKIKTEIAKNIECKIELNFASNSFSEYNLLNIFCEYVLKLHKEELKYEDKNILLLEPRDGIKYLIDEINENDESS